VNANERGQVNVMRAGGREQANESGGTGAGERGWGNESRGTGAGKREQVNANEGGRVRTRAGEQQRQQQLRVPPPPLFLFYLVDSLSENEQQPSRSIPPSYCFSILQGNSNNIFYN
jgi:hypothetical protein